MHNPHPFLSFCSFDDVIIENVENRNNEEWVGVSKLSSCSVNIQILVKWGTCFCLCDPGMFVACWLRGVGGRQECVFPLLPCN